MANPIAIHERAGSLAVESYGRLLAILAARLGDVSLAEDALADAFVSALRTWPERGIPEQPENWLLTVARNRLRDDSRRKAVRESAAKDLLLVLDQLNARRESAFPDERLKLMFVCAHPAIDPAARTPLMLQVVLGLDAARIASAFQVTASAMGQRLSRAKAKIAAAGIPFAVPEPAELPARLRAVLEAIYGAFALAWSDLELRHADLASETIWLSRVLVSLIPEEAEPRALLALLLHAEARRAARRNEQGDFVPLSLQNTKLWSADLQTEAEQHLSLANRLRGGIGPFQLEAAIQSAHASRARTQRTPWRDIAAFYDLLVAMRPSIGAYVARAAAHGQAFGPSVGLEILELTAAFKGRFDYQPYWACLAHLLRESNEDADAAYGRAIDLTPDLAARRYLESQLRTESRQVDA